MASRHAKSQEDLVREMVEAAAGRSLSGIEWSWFKNEDELVEDLGRLGHLDPDGKEDELLRGQFNEEAKAAWGRFQAVNTADDNRRTERSTPRGGASHPIRGWIREDERVRAIALSEWLATMAVHHPRIVEFRATYPDGAPHAGQWPPSAYWSDLRRLAPVLASALPWTEEDAECFLASGDAPLVSPLTASTEAIDYAPDRVSWTMATGTITLVAQAWLSEETIARAFRYLRRDMLGPDTKPIGVRELEVFRFALSHIDAQGQPPESWAALSRAWNQDHPSGGWKYNAPNNLKRTYDAVRKRLLQSSYQWFYRRLGILQWASDNLETGTPSASTEWPIHHDVMRYRASIEDHAARATPPKHDPTVGTVDGNSDGNR